MPEQGEAAWLCGGSQRSGPLLLLPIPLTFDSTGETPCSQDSFFEKKPGETQRETDRGRDRDRGRGRGRERERERDRGRETERERERERETERDRESVER